MKCKLIYLLIVLTGFSCEVFTEKDLTNKEVTLLGPSDGDTSSYDVQTFWWKEMDDAVQFRIQIVSPDFGDASKLFKDSLLVDNRLDMSLIPGEYQWQVRGENADSETPYSTRSLVVTTTDDLTSQTITLISPLESYLVKDDTVSISFTWDKLLTAENYHLMIVRGSFDNPSEVILDENSITQNSYTLPHINTFDEKKVYEWKVRATNATSNTAFSLPRTFSVDSTGAYIDK